MGESQAGTEGDEAARFTRRRVLVLGGSAAGAAVLGAYGLSRLGDGGTNAAADHVLEARSAEVGLGSRTVSTWTYGGSLPGPELRLKQGQPVRIRVDNTLPEPTTVHWHGIRLDNAMDGVPDVTQPAIEPGASFLYEFTPPDAGTFMYHSHVGTQLDRGLYGALIVEPRSEALDYDAEAVLMLDDWLDGVDGTPDDQFEMLRGSGMSMSSGSMGSTSGSGTAMAQAADGASGAMPVENAGRHRGLSGYRSDQDSLATLANDLETGEADPGDVTYPLYLINGRPPEDRFTVDVKRGQRLRLRIANPAADTLFCFYVENHELTVTHADGQPLEPVRTDALVVGMGERYDVLIDARSEGSARIVAFPLGKPGRAEGVLRYAGAPAAPPPGARVSIPRRVLSYDDLVSSEPEAIDRATREISLELTFARPYTWRIDSRAHPDPERISLAHNEPVSLLMDNRTMMPHPMHLHGHFFQPQGPRGTGAQKDTIIVPPMRRTAVNLLPSALGSWMFHCHNVYHQSAGMMRVIEVE